MAQAIEAAKVEKAPELAKIEPMIFYTGSLKEKGAKLDDLPKSVFDRFKDPGEYHPRPELVHAANVALILGQPLLLTGDPGVGKSRFATHLAAALDLADPLEFAVKSTTTARDMLYSFDELRRFRDKEPAPLQSYLAFNALGKAILFSGGANREVEQVPGLAYDPLRDGKRPRTFGDLYPELSPAPQRTVVLIDEFDKAPRDTPNDLLNEIERLRFNIPELGLTLTADPNYRPIIVITSNSERNLPDPFLRRCVYYDIPFPFKNEMMRIVCGQLDEFKQHPDWRDAFLGSALDFFYAFRGRAGLTRSPGTSELLAWLSLLLRDSRIDKTKPLKSNDETVKDLLSALAKVSEDQTAAIRYASSWSPSQSAAADAPAAPAAPTTPAAAENR
jgi:MoxR-like ATPase